MKKFALVLIIAAGCMTAMQRILPAHQTPSHLLEQWQANQQTTKTPAKTLIVDDEKPKQNNVEHSDTNSVTPIENAFNRHQSDVQTEASGTVVKILEDDNKGSRHQKFIVRVGDISVLIAHNIDIAGRVANLAVGDTVFFRGQYEWSIKGGTVHWTHHDPAGRHDDGWLLHNGTIYR